MWRKKSSAKVRQTLDKAMKSYRNVEHGHLHAHMREREATSYLPKLVS